MHTNSALLYGLLESIVFLCLKVSSDHSRCFPLCEMIESQSGFLIALGNHPTLFTTEKTET